MGLVLSNNPVSIIESFLRIDKGDSMPLLIQGILLVVPLEEYCTIYSSVY